MINATLLVQAIHFGIAYFMLTRILLYPAARMLQREDAVREQILQDISELQRTSQDYETFQAQQWRGCLQALSSRKPQAPYISSFRVLDVPVSRGEPPSVDSTIERQMRDIIVHKVQHG